MAIFFLTKDFKLFCICLCGVSLRNLMAKLGYLKESNAAAHSVDSAIFTRFIYNFIHVDASMARCDKGS